VGAVLDDNGDTLSWIYLVYIQIPGFCLRKTDRFPIGCGLHKSWIVESLIEHDLKDRYLQVELFD